MLLNAKSGKTNKNLLILAVGCSIVRLLWFLTIRGWIPTNILIVAVLFFALLTGLVISAVGVIWHVVISLRKKQRLSGVLVPTIILVLTLLIGSRLPSKPAVIFWAHRDEFVRVVDLSIERFLDTRTYQFPSSPLYESATVYEAEHDALVVEFIVSDFYLPLVFISTDEPTDVYDTCSNGGAPIEKLALHWFVCSRDWN